MAAPLTQTAKITASRFSGTVTVHLKNEDQQLKQELQQQAAKLLEGQGLTRYQGLALMPNKKYFETSAKGQTLTVTTFTGTRSGRGGISAEYDQAIKKALESNENVASIDISA